MADAKTSGASAQNGSAKSRAHNDGSSGRAFTIEQKTAVIRVRKCGTTSFYDILGLEEVKSTIDDSGIKKAYRKLSLLTHPDKNGYEGADEAFKMVSRAFQILSDPDKKKRYDQFGGDPDNRFASASAAASSPFSGFARSQGASRGGAMFEEEISPEELFRQFFGGGMGGGGFGSPFGGGLFDQGPGFVFNLGGGPGVRVHQFGGAGPRRRPTRPRDPNEPPPTAFDAFRNLLPLLLLFLVPLLSSIFSGGSSTPVPSFNIDTSIPPLTQHRTTTQWKTEYYVNPIDVVKYSRSDWSHLDNYVDNQHISELKYHCEREQARYQALVQQATGWFSIDQIKLREARSFPRPHCDRLLRMGIRSI